LLAFDIDQQDIRRFRLDRFSSAISFNSPAQHFPADNEGVQAVLADVAKESLEARVSVRVGRGAKIRRNSHLISSDGEWDLLKVPYYDMDELIFNIIWLGDDARVESPNEMREQVIASVENLVRDNG
jgi:proteasome accessory factor B